MEAEFQAAMQHAIAKGKETCATSVSTAPSTWKPRAGYRPPENLSTPTVTAPSNANVPMVEHEEPIVKAISFYDAKLRNRCDYVPD
jgi:hypothetical protein